MNLGWSLCGLVGSKLRPLGREEKPRQERGAWMKLTRGGGRSMAVVTITTIPWAHCKRQTQC